MTTSKLENQVPDQQVRLGGPGALDPQIFVIAASLSLTSSILVGADFQNQSQILALAASNIVALSMLGLFHFVLYKTLNHKLDKKPLSLISLLSIGALAGSGKGFITGAMMFVFGYETDLLGSGAQRAAGTLVVGLWGVPLLSYLGSVRKHAEARAQKIAEELAIDRFVANKESGAPLLLREFINRAKTSLSELQQVSNPETISAKIRGIVENDLRPLSHRIWEEENSRKNSLTAKNLLKLSIFHFGYWPVPISIIYFLSIAPWAATYSDKYGWWILLGRSTILLAGIWLGRRFPQSTFFRSVLFYFMVITLVSTCQELLVFVVTGPEYEFVLNHVLANAIWLVQLTLLSGVIQAGLEIVKSLSHEYKQIMSRINGRKFEDNPREKLLRRSLGHYLHGQVQNRLLSAALKLDSTKQGLELERDINFVTNILNEAEQGFTRATATSINELLHEIAGLWKGVLEVEVKGENCEVRSVHATESVRELVTEALTNAMRHGFASKVSLSAESMSANRIRIRVADNGVGPRLGEKGLGSQLLDLLAPGAWSLEPGDFGGAVLRVDLDVD